MHKSDCVYYEIIENMEHKYFETCNKKTTCCFNCEICSDYITLDVLLDIREKYINSMKNDLNESKIQMLLNKQKADFENNIQRCCCVQYPIPSNNANDYKMPFFNCGINYHEEYNRDCKYYDEEHDMGATIPICTKYDKFGDFDCHKQCGY